MRFSPHAAAVCALCLVETAFGATYGNSSVTSSTSTDSTTTIYETTTFAYNGSSSQTTDYTYNASSSQTTPNITSIPSAQNLTSTVSAQNLTSSRIWSEWTTGNYPSDCDAYYKTITVSGAKSAVPKTPVAWNATENAATYSSASKCLSSLLSYQTASRAFESTEQYIWWSTIVSTEHRSLATWSFTVTDFSTTTLCDGYPRVVTGANVTDKTSISYETVTWVTSAFVTTYNTTYSSSTAPYTMTPPTCKLDCEACSMVQAAADYSLSSAIAISDYTYDPAFAFDCPYAPDPDDTNKDGSMDCAVEIWSAQLFYWPVTTVGGDACNKTGSTITATPTGNGPNTYAFNGTTLTSPTVYVSFYNLSYESVSYNHTYNWIGDTLMGFHSTDIQSQRGYHGMNGNFSFNYADLPPNQVPATAWFGQVDCFPETSACLPIGKYSYGPALAFPSIFLTMSNFNPLWTAKTCALGAENNGIWDPPHALTQVSSAAPATVPVAYTTTASPSQTTAPGPSSTPTGPASQTSTVSKVPGSTTPNVPATPSKYTAEPESTDAPPSANPTTAEQKPTTTDPADPPSTGEQTTEAADPGSGTAGSSSQADASGSEDSASPQGTSSTTTNVGDYIVSALGGSQATQAATTTNAISVLESALGSTADPSGNNGDPAASGSGGASTANAENEGSAPQQSTTFGVGSSTVVAAAQPSGGIVFDGTTYSSNQAVTVGTQVVSVNTAGAIVDGTKTVPLAQASGGDPGSAQATTLDIGGSTVVAQVQSSGGVILDGTTYSSNQAITIGSQVVSINTAGQVIEGSTTVALPSAGADSDPAAGQATTLEIGGSTVVAEVQSSGVVVDGTTYTSNQVITIGSQVVSINTAGQIVEGTTTVVLPSAGGDPGASASEAVVTASGSVLTATEISSGIAAVDHTTLSVGGAPITVGGVVISEASSGLVVDGTSTVAFSDPAASTGRGVTTVSRNAEGASASADPSGLTQAAQPSGSSTSTTSSAARCGFRDGGLVKWVGAFGVMMAMLFC